jgi:hypothetical protein
VAAPSAAASVAPLGKMAHCPSAVEGATTAIADVEGAVQLTVTVPGDAAVADVRARARFLSDAARSTTSTVKHTGRGEGGGIFGRCPVVMRETQVDVTDVPGGAQILVRPKDAAQLDWLRRETRERNEEDVVAPASKGAGNGKMSHCPSAVDGSSTAIKDGSGKGAFDVVVTATSEPAIKEIRVRARHLVEASKLDAGEVAHTGDGTGGGGVGRCPVVMKDTVVTAKDIDGGAVLTVAPTRPETLAVVRHEAQDRVEKFGVVTK